MYIIGFIIAYVILTWRRKKGLFAAPSQEAVQDMLFYGFVGLLVGGRLGACFLYEPIFYLTHPWKVFYVWNGGMSSHGGFLGGTIGLYFFARRYKIPLLHLLDTSVIACTPGLFLGRIGNFINGELCGRVTSVSWAVIFPKVDMLPRHPVQIYQAFTEGFILFFVLLYIGRKPRSNGLLSGIFALGYGVMRIITEHFRAESDVLAGPAWMLSLTKGQFYSIALIIIGAVLLLNAYRKGKSSLNTTAFPPPPES